MLNANIVDDKENITLRGKLTPGDRKKLQKRLTGYGKMAAAALRIGVGRHTLYNAMHGLPLKKDNYNKITEFLNTK